MLTICAPVYLNKKKTSQDACYRKRSKPKNLKRYEQQKNVFLVFRLKGRPIKMSSVVILGCITIEFQILQSDLKSAALFNQFQFFFFYVDITNWQKPRTFELTITCRESYLFVYCDTGTHFTHYYGVNNYQATLGVHRWPESLVVATSSYQLRSFLTQRVGLGIFSSRRNIEFRNSLLLIIC